jgi:hypothetical protein
MKRNDERGSLITGKDRTFLGSKRNLEMVFDAAAKPFQFGVILWKRDFGELATCIGYNIDRGEGKLCEERMINELEVAVERKLVLILVFILGKRKMRDLLYSS